MRITFCMFFLLLLIKSSFLFSQVAINADGSNPNNSAMLDVKSNNKGFLPPRMTRAAMTTITNPADGLMVYCTDCSQDGSGVLCIFMGGDWKLLTANFLIPLTPTAKTHVPSITSIVWDWKGVSHATGYKWSSTNNFATATEMDTLTTKTETGLTCSTAYTRYVWAYNASGNSLPLTLTRTTLVCEIPTLSTTIVSSIATSTATGGGNITDDGGSTVTVRGVIWGTTSKSTTSTTSMLRTFDGSGSGNFESNITGLTENTTYYVRAYATNSIGTAYGNEIMFKTLPATGTTTDIDGNIYHYVTIGTQTWMVENLKTTKYRNGQLIAYVPGNLYLLTPYYCWYNHDAATYKAAYGALYSWYAVADSRNIAPTGWHVPTDAEWTTLTDYLGGITIAGGKLKESGTSHWQTPNTDATNSSSFTALPGGYRNYLDGSFNDVGLYGYWWSSTAYDATSAWSRYLYSGNDNAYRVNYNKQNGFSVRCVRD